MTIDRIYELTKKISQEMKIIGIPISGNINKITVNNRTRKRLGACLRELLPGGEQRFTIEISAKALEYEDFQLSGIIAHELLHTCPGSFDHGKKWKEYSEKTERLLGYHIKRMVNFEELGISAPKEAESIKYTAVCKMCGQQYLLYSAAQTDFASGLKTCAASPVSQAVPYEEIKLCNKI